jgi:hypothetical protein
VTGALVALLLAAGPDAPGAAPAGEPPEATPLGVTVRASAAQVRLGQPFDYQVEIRHLPGESYALPREPALEPFRAQPGGCRRLEAGGEVTTTCSARLALFALGPHEVPPLRLEVRTPGGERRLTVPGPRVEGVGVIDPRAPSSSLELRPPAPPVPLLVRSFRLLAWAAGLLGAAALAALLWRRRRRAGAPTEAPPPLPPHERFARQLSQLEAAPLPEPGRARELVVRLSDAVREYLAALTGVPALDLTTRELLERLAAAGDPRLDLQALRAFSQDADLVKFARFPAGPAEWAAGLRFGRRLLEATRPAPVAPQAEAARPGEVA